MVALTKILRRLPKIRPKNQSVNCQTLPTISRIPKIESPYGLYFQIFSGVKMSIPVQFATLEHGVGTLKNFLGSYSRSPKGQILESNA
jgi:hypothetical protein